MKNIWENRKYNELHCDMPVHMQHICEKVSHVSSDYYFEPFNAQTLKWAKENHNTNKKPAYGKLEKILSKEENFGCFAYAELVNDITNCKSSSLAFVMFYADALISLKDSLEEKKILDYKAALNLLKFAKNIKKTTANLRASLPTGFAQREADPNALFLTGELAGLAEGARQASIKVLMQILAQQKTPASMKFIEWVGYRYRVTKELLQVAVTDSSWDRLQMVADIIPSGQIFSAIVEPVKKVAKATNDFFQAIGSRFLKPFGWLREKLTPTRIDDHKKPTTSPPPIIPPVATEKKKAAKTVNGFFQSIGVSGLKLFGQWGKKPTDIKPPVISEPKPFEASKALIDELLKSKHCDILREKDEYGDAIGAPIVPNIPEWRVLSLAETMTNHLLKMNRHFWDKRHLPYAFGEDAARNNKDMEEKWHSKHAELSSRFLELRRIELAEEKRKTEEERTAKAMKWKAYWKKTGAFGSPEVSEDLVDTWLDAKHYSVRGWPARIFALPGVYLSDSDEIIVQHLIEMKCHFLRLKHHDYPDTNEKWHSKHVELSIRVLELREIARLEEKQRAEEEWQRAEKERRKAEEEKRKAEEEETRERARTSPAPNLNPQDQWLHNTKWLLSGTADTNYYSVIRGILDSSTPLETMKKNLENFINDFKNISYIEEDLLKKLLDAKDNLKIEIKKDQRSILAQLLYQKQDIASKAKRHYAKQNSNIINEKLIAPINKEYDSANEQVFLKDKQEELDSILKQLSKDFEELNAEFTKNNARISLCMQNQMKLIKESKDELKEYTELKSYKCLLSVDASKIPKKGKILFCVSGDNVTVKIQEQEKLNEFAISSSSCFETSKGESIPIYAIVIAASKRKRMAFTPDDEKQLLQSTLFSQYIPLKGMIENKENPVNMIFPEIERLINSAATCINNIKTCKEDLLSQARGLKGNNMFHELVNGVSDQTLAQAAHRHGVQCL